MKTLIRNYVTMHWRKQAIIVFVAAFVIRFGYVCVTNQLTANPPKYSEQVRIARYILHGTGFVSPVGPERDDPSSWYVPGYIGFITGAFWAFGEDSAAAYAFIRVVNLLTLAGAIAIWVIVGRYFLGRRCAAIAALLMIFSPAISYKAAEIWDTFPTMLCGVLCLGMLLKYRLERTWSQILAGVVLGLVAMVNPCFSACYAIWVVANWKYWNQNSLIRRHFVLRVIFIFIGFLAAITPWSIRNRVVFGEWFYLRSNLGFEMWLGNAPWSDGYFFTHDGKRMHPIFNPDEESQLVQAGEAKYLEDRAAEVWGYFHTDTARVAKLCLKRVKWFWFGRFAKDSSWGTWLLKFIGFTIPGILALAGMVHLLIRRRYGWVLLVTMMVFPIPYYLSIMMVRYRLPMEPLLLLMAAWFISVVYERWSQQQRKSTYSQLLHNQ